MFSKRSNQQKARRSGLVKSNLMRGLMSVGVMYSGAQAMTIKDWVVEKNLAQVESAQPETGAAERLGLAQSDYDRSVQTMAEAIQTLVQTQDSSTIDDLNTIDEKFIKLAKQLVDMVDKLPVMEQCMTDVENGFYNPTDVAIVASGGQPQTAVDPSTGQPVQILVSSLDDLIDENSTLQLKSADSDQVIEVQASANNIVEDVTETASNAVDNLTNAANSISGKALHTAASIKEQAKQRIADAEAAADEAKMTVLNKAGDASTDFEAAIEAEAANSDEQSEESVEENAEATIEEEQTDETSEMEESVEEEDDEEAPEGEEPAPEEAKKKGILHHIGSWFL